MHPHLRSYVGQARVALYSAINQLQMAQEAFKSAPVPGSLLYAAADVEELIEQLEPLLEKVIHTHRLVVNHEP